MLKRIVAPVVLLALASGFAAYAVSTQPTDRPDCPGKIVCPLTGELVCKDRCPLGAEARADCPGKIECPIDGALVCKDRCPLTAAVQADASTLPPCCRGAK